MPMARISRHFREGFDRGREFAATRNFKYAGVDYTPGQAIEKGAFTDRRLRQLYDHRQIEMLPISQSFYEKVEPPKLTPIDKPPEFAMTMAPSVETTSVTTFSAPPTDVVEPTEPVTPSPVPEPTVEPPLAQEEVEKPQPRVARRRVKM